MLLPNKVCPNTCSALNATDDAVEERAWFKNTSTAWDTAYVVLGVTTNLILLVRCSLSCLSCGKHQQKGQALRAMRSTGLAAVRLLA